MKIKYVLIVFVISLLGCVNKSKSNSDSILKDSEYTLSAKLLDQSKSNVYINNRLQTGDIPYVNVQLYGEQSEIVVRTSVNSNSDLVVIVKYYGSIVRNAYIVAGDSYTFYVPNGKYQIFFYSGKGWNPNKNMGNGYIGGFVENESYSKDTDVFINNQRLEYELIPQRNGNFSTKQSDKSEVF